MLPRSSLKKSFRPIRDWLIFARKPVLQQQILQPDLRHAVHAVAAVVAEVGAGRDFHQLYLFYPLAHGQDGQGLQFKAQGVADCLAVEGAHDQGVEPDFHGLERHALQGNSQIDINHGRLRRGAADHDEGLGLGARGGQVQLGQVAAQVQEAAEVRPAGGRVEQLEPQGLGVAAGRNLRVHGNDRLQLPLGNHVRGVVGAVAAVPQ